jgi:hypothetical protein
MAIFSQNELTRGEASVRDLETREQQAVPRDRRLRISQFCSGTYSSV